MTVIALPASVIVAGRAGASMRKRTRLFPAHVATRDPEYYVGRAMLLVFALIGFIDVLSGGVIWHP